MEYHLQSISLLLTRLQKRLSTLVGGKSEENSKESVSPPATPRNERAIIEQSVLRPAYERLLNLEASRCGLIVESAFYGSVASRPTADAAAAVTQSAQCFDVTIPLMAMVRVRGSGLRIRGSGFGVHGSGFGVEGSGFS